MLGEKTGQGVRLIGSSVNLQTLLDHLRHEALGDPGSSLWDTSPQGRERALALRLLSSSEEVRLYTLAQELYVSTATIQKDLEGVQTLLSRYRISVHRAKNHGIRVEGRERRIRHCLTDLIVNSQRMQELTQMVLGNKTLPLKEPLVPGLSLRAEDVVRFGKTWRSASKPFLKDLSVQSFMSLLILSYVSFSRFREGHEVTLSEEFIHWVQQEPYYEEVTHLAKAIEHDYGVRLPAVELRFIQVYCISQRKGSEQKKEEEKEAQDLADALIGAWSLALGEDLSPSTAARTALLDHLLPSLTRFRHGIYLENPLLGEIRAKYRRAYRIVYEGRHFIEARYHTLPSEEEIGYLTLHLVRMLADRQVPLQALLICDMGPGGCNLLKEQLLETFPRMEVLAIQNPLTFQEEMAARADVILTTLSWTLCRGGKVVPIGRILTPAALEEIKKRLSQVLVQKNQRIQP